MNILEKEIEEIVFLSDNELLAKKGLHLYSHKMHQVNFGSYGIADIVCWNRIDTSELKVLKIQVVELKKELIDINTLLQASRYAKAIKHICSKFNLKNTYIDIEIVLIGKRINTTGDFVNLADFIGNLNLYTYKINLEEGIKFYRQKGWYKMDETGIDTHLDLFLEDYKNTYYVKPRPSFFVL